MGSTAPIRKPTPDDSVDTTASTRSAAVVPRTGSGGGEALPDLIASYRPALVGFILNQVGDPGAAEDLAHDVVVRAMLHIDDIEPHRPMLPWLLTITRRRLIDHYRRASTAREGEHDPRVAETLGPAGTTSAQGAFDDHTVCLEEREFLDQAMMSLSRRQRSAMLLHDVSGWDADQIATLHGRSRNAIHQLLHRARARVRDEYQRLNGDGRVLSLLPWPLLWVADLGRRGTDRIWRMWNEWQLVVPAASEPFAGLAVAATIGLGGGVMMSGGVSGAAAAELPEPDHADLVPAATATAVTHRPGNAAHMAQADVVQSDGSTQEGPEPPPSSPEGDAAKEMIERSEIPEGRPDGAAEPTVSIEDLRADTGIAVDRGDRMSDDRHVEADEPGREMGPSVKDGEHRTRDSATCEATAVDDGEADGEDASGTDSTTPCRTPSARWQPSPLRVMDATT